MFWFLLCLVWLLLNGSCPSVAVVFESIAPLNFSPLGHSCFALGPHRSVFHLSCADLVSPVSPVSLAAKGLAWLWCFWCFCLVLCGFCVWFGCFVFAFLLVFGFFWCCLISLCSFARLSSFTDWCTAHRQQFREQKNSASALSAGGSRCKWLNNVVKYLVYASCMMTSCKHKC